MACKIVMDDWDYKRAIEAVQKLLDEIEAVQEEDESLPEIKKMPSASHIVDTVLDHINQP